MFPRTSILTQPDRFGATAGAGSSRTFSLLTFHCILFGDPLFSVAGIKRWANAFQVITRVMLAHSTELKDPVARDVHAGTHLITRRSFLARAGLLAAGSAFASSWLSCDSGFEIPCLGPAPPPEPRPGMTYIWASKIGCALDCDLRNGRNKNRDGAATDDGPRINAAMANASAENPITLIIDGSALISGLFLPAGGHWNIAGLGCGTGFFVAAGTNNDAIHNGPRNAAVPSDPGPPAPARGRNVSLKNFTVNGNQGNGANGNSSTGTRQGTNNTWFFGINLMNLDNIDIERVVVVNTPAYQMRFSNVGNVSVSGCVLKSYGLSTDGLHFNGPANDITITDCDITSGDDAIALNCPEGYSGDISRVNVSNCTSNSVSLMRLYTTRGWGAKFAIDGVNVTNCRAKASEAAFLIGMANGSNPNSVASLAVSNCAIAAPSVLGLAENFGTIEMNNVSLLPMQSRTTWIPPQANHICAFVRPSPLYGGVTCVGSKLSFENCVINRYEDVQAAALFLDNDSVIETVIFNGFAITNGGGSPSPVPMLIGVSSGFIGALVLQAVDSSSISAPISDGGFASVGSVSGAGVLPTGWEFPDAVMADGVPYLSQSTGQASVKIGGVVQTYGTALPG